MLSAASVSATVVAIAVAFGGMIGGRIAVVCRGLCEFTLLWTCTA